MLRPSSWVTIHIAHVDCFNGIVLEAMAKLKRTTVYTDQDLELALRMLQNVSFISILEGKKPFENPQGIAFSNTICGPRN
jgi:hypothetical protein